jgi:hypothetical protein
MVSAIDLPNPEQTTRPSGLRSIFLEGVNAQSQVRGCFPNEAWKPSLNGIPRSIMGTTRRDTSAIY